MFRTFIAAALVACAAPALVSAQSAEGVWRTGKMRMGGSANIRIAPCDSQVDRLCGKIVEVFDSPRADLMGAPIIQDMAAKGQGRWTGGKVFSPDKDRLYDSHMELVPEGLEVKACVAAICKAQLWARVD